MRQVFLQTMMFFALTNIFAQYTHALLLEDTTYYYSDKDFELIVAASAGDTNKLVAFLEIGADVNTSTYDGVTPLMFAAQNGHLRVVEILIDSGANVNAKPDNMMDALLGACFAGHVEIADTLILNGANVNTQNFDEVTPLMYAAAYDYLTMADMLLFYKAKVNQTDFQGNTALHLSTFYNNIEISELLLKNMAQVDKTDTNGFTPLMVAAQNGSIEHIELFLLNGADLNKTNNHNLDALSLAIIAKQDHVIEYLISKGIRIERNISKRMNQYDLSQLYGSRLSNEILKNAGGSPQLKTWVDKMFINPAIQFNGQDVMMGFQTGIIDSKNGLQLEAGYKTRPWVRSVLYEVNENTYYQFWEKRSVVHLGLEKNFNLTSPFYYEKLGIFGGINFAYTYGNFRGSDRKPDDGLKLNPKAGIFYFYKAFNVKLNYEYMKFNNNTSSPHRIGISFGVIINLVEDRIKLKPEPVL